MAQRIDHTRAEDLFSAYIDQHVTVDERVFVERHVAGCAACRAQLQATRSMVAALRTLPAVKAPRSFVLPKSPRRAAQSKPSIFNWYPALRLATVMMAVAFVLVFASDLLIARSSGGGNVIMSAPAAEAPTAPDQAPTAVPMAKSSPADQAPPAAPAAGNAAHLSAATMAAADASRAALSAQAAPTETKSAAALTATIETPATAALAPTVESTPAIAAPASSLPTEVPPSIDPLRLASIVLGGLVVALGAVTLILRQKT